MAPVSRRSTSCARTGRTSSSRGVITWRRICAQNRPSKRILARKFGRGCLPHELCSPAPFARVLVPSYNDPVLWDGHASLIHEIRQQLPDGTTPDAIFCSAGGGGLAGGIMSGCKAVGWDHGERACTSCQVCSSLDANMLYSTSCDGRNTWVKLLLSVSIAERRTIRRNYGVKEDLGRNDRTARPGARRECRSPRQANVPRHVARSNLSFCCCGQDGTSTSRWHQERMRLRRDDDASLLVLCRCAWSCSE